jgi:hypothetical protein
MVYFPLLFLHVELFLNSGGGAHAWFPLPNQMAADFSETAVNI